MGELQASLNTLAGTSGLDAQGAANVWAGTTKLDLLGALNAKAGTSGVGLNRVCNLLAGTSGLDAQGALGSAASLDPLLAEAVVLLRASQFTGADGDDWVNEGTGGSAYNAEAVGTPNYVTSPEPGFEFGGGGGDPADGPHYQVPDGAALDAGTGSFTVMARIRWTHATGDFDNVCAKLTGAMGSDADGWQIATGAAVGDVTIGLASSHTVGGPADAFGTNPAAVTGAELVDATDYLLVLRLDRGPNTLTLFVNGVESDNNSAAGVTNVNSTNPWILGRDTPTQIGRDYAYWDRALTDTEITVTLPAALA